MLITTHKSVQDEMVEDFVGQIGEMDKLMSSAVGGDMRGWAERKKRELVLSLEELRKQMKDPARHLALEEGTSPNANNLV